jgi:hypothetical protein
VDDTSIIDVPEEPLVPPPRQPVADSYQPAAYAYEPADAPESSTANRTAEPYEATEADRTAHPRRGDRAARAQQDESTPPTGWAAQGTSPASGAEPQPEPQPARRSHRRQEAPPQPEPRFAPPPAPPEQQRPEWSEPAEAPRREETPVGWQPVSSDGEWLPAGTPGSNWTSESSDNTGTGSWYDAASRESTAPIVDRQGRHSSAAEPANQIGESEAGWREPAQRAPSRHSAEYPDIGGSATPPPAMSPPPPPMPPSPPSPADREPAMSPPPAPTARHRSTDALDTDAPPSGGQSVAELLARLQTSPSSGGRRRRRED